jgi:DNA-directed RNA polymerase I and III subunit RPAC1
MCINLSALVNVETSGIIPAEQIFLHAVDVFMDKIKDIQPLVDRVVSSESA